MELRPILSAMRRNKVGAFLIGIQMAITLAILCNALFIIEQRVALSKRPTGLDEPNVFVVTNQWVGDPKDLKSKLLTDLAAMRAVPDVVDATATNSYPLGDGGSTEGVKMNAEQRDDSAKTALYLGDEHALAAMGLKLVAGRNFNADEVNDKSGFDDGVPPASIIVTRALADKLFPAGNALGQSIYVHYQKHQVPIVGIAERLQVPWTTAGGWGSTFNDNSVLEPFRYEASLVHYIIRAKPGQRTAVMKAVERRLFEVSRMRVLSEIKSQSASRIEAYKDDHGLAVILGVVCGALLAVTAFGIVGLTSYWVAQRSRQIGIRRALGATRNAIVSYFQTENFLIAAAGAVVGVALAMALNLWMMSFFATERLNGSYTLIGAAMVLLLGQAAALWPALKAASIPPALATRGSI
jgi:putative ABC transport system permease protein